MAGQVVVIAREIKKGEQVRHPSRRQWVPALVRAGRFSIDGETGFSRCAAQPCVAARSHAPTCHRVTS